jgi:hypothetical protein
MITEQIRSTVCLTKGLQPDLRGQSSAALETQRELALVARSTSSTSTVLL